MNDIKKQFYISTYSGKYFDPEKPGMEDIDINDIAHALSMLARANGHFEDFFSVGAHSVNCALESMARGNSPKVSLACLLHDGAEAYIGDMTRPLKIRFPKFKEIEVALQNAIFQKYANVETFPPPYWNEVMDIDNSMLFFEFKEFHPTLNIQKEVSEIHIDIKQMKKESTIVEMEFLNLFYELKK